MDMANPLAASSMLLAIVALLFGAWTGEVTQTLAIRFEPQIENRGAQREQIRGVIRNKAFPLTTGAWLAVTVFVWRSGQLILGALACRFSPSCSYDDVAAAFVLTEAFVAVVAVSATGQLFKLHNKLNESDRP